MDNELSLDDILRLTTQEHTRRSYAKNLAEFLGKSLEEVEKELGLKPIKIELSRGERIQNIMMKRYGVPESLIDALLEEYENDW